MKLSERDNGYNIGDLLCEISEKLDDLNTLKARFAVFVRNQKDMREELRSIRQEVAGVKEEIAGLRGSFLSSIDRLGDRLIVAMEQFSKNNH